MDFSSSSSSSTKHKWIYDVFLSFRGVETRYGFTSRLYNALRQAGIHAFKDDQWLATGEEISGSLLQAIEGSRIALVIFSPEYASSSWCLDELVKIMECKRTLGQLVIPIFYKVTPSDVRHQRGRYGKALEQQKRRFKMDLVLRWRQALTEAANLSGWEVSLGRDENELVEDIVNDLLKRLDVEELSVADHPVGIESRVLELTNEWLNKRSQDVLIIGLGEWEALVKQLSPKPFTIKLVATLEGEVSLQMLEKFQNRIMA